MVKLNTDTKNPKTIIIPDTPKTPGTPKVGTPNPESPRLKSAGDSESWNYYYSEELASFDDDDLSSGAYEKAAELARKASTQLRAAAGNARKESVDLTKISREISQAQMSAGIIERRLDQVEEGIHEAEIEKPHLSPEPEKKRRCCGCCILQ